MESFLRSEFVCHLIDEAVGLHETRMFNTVFTTARHLKPP
jgi:hypothetical protein